MVTLGGRVRRNVMRFTELLRYRSPRQRRGRVETGAGPPLRGPRKLSHGGALSLRSTTRSTLSALRMTRARSLLGWRVIW